MIIKYVFFCTLFILINFNVYFAQQKIDQVLDQKIEFLKDEIVKEDLKKELAKGTHKTKSLQFTTNQNTQPVSLKIRDLLKGKLKELHHPNIEFFEEYYQTMGKYHLQEGLFRLSNVAPLVLAILKKYNLPNEFILLPLILSNYDNLFVSSKNKAGIWQINPLLAKIYNLKIDTFLDERKDIEKSTMVACSYLIELYQNYGQDWDLALVGFAGGGIYIQNRLRGNKQININQLLSDSSQSDSIEILARFHALINILKDPKTTTGNRSISLSSSFTRILNQKSGISFKDISSKINIPLEILQNLNPHLKKQSTVKSSYLYIPPFYAKLFETKIDQFKSQKNIKNISSQFKPSKKKIITVHHVSKGDTLFSIAQKYHLSTQQLKNYNHLTNTRLIIGQDIKLIPEPIKQQKQNIKYIVQKGDTLFSIAKRFHVSINELSFKGNATVIYPGMEIKIKNV